MYITIIYNKKINLPIYGELVNSHNTFPRVFPLFPHAVMGKFSSISLIKPENIFTLKSQHPAASSTLFGCQSIEFTVDLIGFFICFETHQSFACSK